MVGLLSTHHARLHTKFRIVSGMLLFQDGSKHAWLPEGPERDLIVTMDDATSAILSAVLVEEEGTASSFVGLKETIAAHGLFCALYTDRGSHYFHTPTAGEPVDKTCLTQVGRALKQLGIEHIPSYSPEARGRMERLFGTLQSRLPPLMRQEGLASIEAANRWLATVYIPQHNARFAVAAAEEGSAFVPFVGALETSCVSRRSAWWGTTTRSATRVACCRPAGTAPAATSSR